MYLNDEEKRMLDGEFGAGTAEAMKLQVALGEAFDAERMVEISRAHVSLAHYPSDVWYTAKLAAGGARCRINPTCNPLYDLHYLEDVGIRDPAEHAEQTLDAGVPVQPVCDMDKHGVVQMLRGG